MNWKHLKAILWLRWRILSNRARRTGKVGRVVMGLLLIAAMLVAVVSFVAALFFGVDQLPGMGPMDLFMAWAALCLGFLFSWSVGLLSDLQRSDAMSFKNLLHLPVSLSWVFLYNYLSSFVSLSVMIFVPPMIGLGLAMIIVWGFPMLLALVLVAAFLIMVTAVTYQLRGWLARLMEDKRRARNIISLLTLLLILLAQTPNLINMRIQGGSRSERRAERSELRKLRRVAGAGGEGQAEALRKIDLHEEQEALEDAAIMENANLAALVLPVGWLPYGMRAAAERRWCASMLCALGMFAIGAWSLQRAYGKTLQGSVQAGGKSAVVPQLEEMRTDPIAATRKPTSNFVRRAIPFVTPRTAGIARLSLISFLRSPESKLLLLSPIILLGFYGYLLSGKSSREPLADFSAMHSLGAVAMGMISVMQMIQNQFGLDRGGFRAYLLCPIPRHEILLGKNIAMAPIGLGIGTASLVLIQVFLPLGALHFLGACFQLGSAYLLLCMLWNLVSILAPVRLKDAGMKPANATFKSFLLQLLAMAMVPLTLAPLLAPAILEFLLGWQDTPAFAGLHLLGFIGIAIGYRWIVRKQGTLLQEREQRILDVLTHD
ncbi:MAG: hypothetical protein GY930_15705 [bacterium]|nr:hypothetical protein [bacterium]